MMPDPMIIGPFPDGAPAPATLYYACLSLRDYFAGQALAGIMARAQHNVYLNFGEDDESFNPTIAAEDAYEVADAMLEARKGK